MKPVATSNVVPIRSRAATWTVMLSDSYIEVSGVVRTQQDMRRFIRAIEALKEFLPAGDVEPEYHI